MDEAAPDGYEGEVVEWRAIAGRDQEVFAKWLSRNESTLRRRLHSFATRVDVEAVLQEAALLLWERTAAALPDGLRAIEPDGKPGFLYRWTVTVATNRALNRQERARREQPLEDAEDAGSQPSLPDPILRNRLTQCIEKLSRSLRAALVGRIRDRGQHSDKDLAVSLGIAYDAFRTNLHRARKAVEKCLDSHGINFREYV